MNKRTVKFGLAVASLVLLPQCDLFKKDDSAAPAPAQAATAQSSAPADKSEVLMSIDGKASITKDSFEDYMNEFLEAQPQYKQIVEFMPDAKRNIFDGQVNEEIISAWADKNNLASRKEYQKDRAKIIKFAERSLNVKYFQDAHPSDVSPVDVRKYYDENKTNPQLMKSPGGVKASAVIFKDKSAADSFFDKVKAGTALANVAKEAGLEAKDLGLVSAQSYEVEGPLREAILAVKTFPKTEVVKISDSAFAVYRAASKQEPEYVAFEEVKEGITNFLKQQKTAEVIQKAVEALKKKYQVVLNEEFFERAKKSNQEKAPAAQAPKGQPAPKEAAPANKPVAA